MRREDTRYRFLLQEIEAFTGVYKQTAQAWFTDFTSDPSNITDQEHGYRRVFPKQVLARIEGFETLKRLFQPFGRPEPTRFFLPYYDQVIAPFNNAMEQHLATWWRREWRRQWLDFAHIPPAPSTRPEALIPCGFRTWRYTDQLLVRIEGGMRARRCQVSTCCTGYVIWSLPLPPAPLRILPHLLLPRLHRLASLTDWRQLEHLPPPVSRALAKRVSQLITFYTTRPLQVTPLPLPAHGSSCLHSSLQHKQRPTPHE